MSLPQNPTTARERILEAARRLFYQQGIRATGVDRIIAESGVAKMSFYRNFPSKKDLVLAFLERRHDFWMGWFTARVSELGGGKPGLAVMADVLREWFSQPDFRGCAFINTVAEACDCPTEEFRIAQSHKQDLCDFVETLVPSAPQAEAKRIARLAVLVIDGAIVRAQMTQDPEVAEEARALLSLLEAEAGLRS